MDDEKVTNLICPFLKKECIGKRCALAISIDHYSVDPYDVLWQCGLVSTSDSNRYGKAQILFAENIIEGCKI